ncbi:MAG: C40 family peptidase [Caulobacteraceae bacterium]|nr:C40 family peptidase [Caulobacteraceae bacterium]
MTDPRVLPWREGLAARSLEGVVAAERYVDPTPMQVVVPALGVRRSADPASEQVDQLLAGERFEVLEIDGDLAWGQVGRDGYVGHVAADGLEAAGAPPTHRLAARLSYAFARPDIKAPAVGPFSMNALMRLGEEEAGFSRTRFGWMRTSHFAPIGVFETDPAAVAERFLGAAYRWGGREGSGLDCSGLVQQALFACGRACPRDSDLQERLGRPIERAELARNDLVFWAGHVAMMLDEARIVHANGFHMAVAVEPLAEAIPRIEAAGVGRPIAYRRL